METASEITVIGVANTGSLGQRAADAIGVFLDGATRVNEIHMTDVRSMVTNVIAQADGGKISRLNILDHGVTDASGCYIGANWIDVTTFENHAPFLAKLYPHFAKGAIVQLQHCYVGRNEDLLRMFALTFGASVYAGTGAHNSVYRLNFGDYVRCSPSGTIYHNVFRP